MGFWSKLGKGLQKGLEVSGMIAPVLPIPDKAKRIIVKADKIEDDVTAIVGEFKKPKPQSAVKVDGVKED